MKTWMNAELVELNINATANIPTQELAADDFQDGYFIQGVRNTSGPAETIIYAPGKN